MLPFKKRLKAHYERRKKRLTASKGIIHPYSYQYQLKMQHDIGSSQEH